jgi:hypothetical protein
MTLTAIRSTAPLTATSLRIEPDETSAPEPVACAGHRRCAWAGGVVYLSVVDIGVDYRSDGYSRLVATVEALAVRIVRSDRRTARYRIRERK